MFNFLSYFLADSESLDYYTMKRVTFLSLREANENPDWNEKFSFYEIAINLIHELDLLDRKYPFYGNLWVENYNKDRVKAGVPLYIHSEKEKQDYINTKNELVRERFALDATNIDQRKSHLKMI